MSFWPALAGTTPVRCVPAHDAAGLGKVLDEEV
jgi:hypothetical protein